VIDCLDPAFPQRLRAVVEEGVDLFFDNSGYHQLALALSLLKDRGNIVLCGPLSGNAQLQDPGAGGEFTPQVMKAVSLRGHIFGRYHMGRLLPIRAELAATMRSYDVTDHCAARLPMIRAELAGLVRAQHLRAVVSEFDGLKHAPVALATVVERGLPHAGSGIVWISETRDIGQRRATSSEFGALSLVESECRGH
jgi:NADPH-dependent curcumin reductase CurA